MSGCPPEDALAALAEGTLPGDVAADLWQHVEACLACLAQIERWAEEGVTDDIYVTAGLEPRRPSEATREAPAPVVARPVPWEPPPEFDGFQLERALGRGGMGQVYLARDTVLDRHVALKFIAADNSDPKALERFRLEARAIARLQHPNVVAVFRIGEVLGRPYIAYEFVSGQRVDKLPKPVRWADALHIGLGLARGLAAAHAKSVLHRDIKPANAIFGVDGEVKLIDFGLAKLVDPKPDRARRTTPPPAFDGPTSAPGGGDVDQLNTPQLPGLDDDMPRSATPRTDPNGHLTHGGQVLGTPAYIAPELWNGCAATTRSDVFALGLLLYELCAGRLPHAGLDLRTMVRWIQRRELPPLRTICPDVPEMLAEVIDQCVQRTPDKRYPSGEEVRAALQAAHDFLLMFGHDRTSLPPEPSTDLVTASFARVRPRAEVLAGRIYDLLFEREPQIRALFPQDLATQRKKLAVALHMAIDSLHAPGPLSAMLEELGRKHAAYGVQRRHLDAFGQALIEALQESDKANWTPALARAWQSAFQAIAEPMLLGLDEAPLSGFDQSAPRTRNASHDDVTLAYQVLGEGPMDLVVVQGWVTHLEAVWGHRAPAALLRGLASFARVILLDQRGTGLSDRDGAGASPEQRMGDLRAVLDEVGSERAALLGVAAGAAPCVHFAARHPHRTLALVLYGATARVAAAPDFPDGLTEDAIEQTSRELRNDWGQRPLLLEQLAPSMAEDASFRRWWATYLKLGASAACAIRMLKTSMRIDLRGVLPRVTAPTLVLQRAGDRTLPPGAGLDLARRIKGSRFVALPGDDHLPFAGDTRTLLHEIRRFLSDVAQPEATSDVIPTGPPPPPGSGRASGDG